MEKLKLWLKWLQEEFCKELEDVKKDLKNPKKEQKSIPLWAFTLGYIVCVCFLILGITANPGSQSDPIPMEDLPIAIPIFIALYFLILGIMKLLDRRHR